MRRPKGISQLDNFYVKSQQHIIKCALSGKSPVVSDWEENVFFVSDRQSFFLIPSHLFCLSDKFYVPCEKLYLEDKHYVRDVYVKQQAPAVLTGNRLAVPLSEMLAIELDKQGEKIFVSSDVLRAFPKKCTFSVNLYGVSPVFVHSVLGVLLGGAWPLDLPNRA